MREQQSRRDTLPGRVIMFPGSAALAEAPFRRPPLHRVPLGEGMERCSHSDVLQMMIEVESSRRQLESYAADLSRLAAESEMVAREAQHRERTKSDFLATMSHEIRTPLNGILGMTAILAGKELGDSERDCVEVIRRSGETLLAIINDVLDLSKIEADRLELEAQNFNLRDMLDNAVQIVGVRAGEKGLSIDASVGESVTARLRGDSVRLGQIVLNLLSNAVKFTDEGTILLRVESVSPQAVAVPSADHVLLFTVTDRGIGMTGEQQAKLFRPFSQADASTTRRFGGTGLGLTICKRLVEMMGGEIGVESALGEGSTFWFTVRLAAATPEVCAPPEATGLVPLHRLATARILLVEDNQVNQKVATLMLKKLSCEIDIAANGAEAVQALASGTYDLVFMDCQMPVMDGLHATRTIREGDGAATAVPIIAMTASAFAEDREACLAAGMNDYLSKPVTEKALREKLERWLPSPL